MCVFSIDLFLLHLQVTFTYRSLQVANCTHNSYIKLIYIHNPKEAGVSLHSHIPDYEIIIQGI